MCGFLCVVTRPPLADAIDLHALDRDILRHRGPDAAGEIRFGHAYVRHWRLSIVDLTETSSQPYGDGSSWLIYNGEIYNYDELANRLSLRVKGDTPLLYEFCRRGSESRELERVRGFYSYVYLSDDGLALSGARDPFGKKPLFFHIDDARGIAVFASEEKAILDCLGGGSVDFGSLAQYLLYKQVFHGRTYFQGIEQLAPGARFRFDARRWTFSVDRDWTAYYRAAAADVFALEPDEEAVTQAADGRVDELMDERLSESLALRIPRDVTAAVAMSGGVDSSLLARLATAESHRPAISRFVTIGFRQSDCDESTRAAEIAAALGITDSHSIVPFPEADMLALLKRCVERAGSPLEHPHHLSYFVLCEYASRFSKVLITGEGADELFMGYEHYRTTGTSFAFREYLTPDDERGFRSAATERPFDFIRRDAAVEPLRVRALGSRALSREYELKSHLLTLLSRNDKMGMANSVEIRAPFLDRKLLALALTLTDADLVAGGQPKAPLHRLFAARFPGMAAPRRKIGFRVPFDEMFLAERRRGDRADACALAARVLGERSGLELRSLDAVSPRLGWSLLNIGMFLDLQGGDARATRAVRAVPAQ
jgi:asparagine synthase (glutamine-hydrolysing)